MDSLEFLDQGWIGKTTVITHLAVSETVDSLHHEAQLRALLEPLVTIEL